MINGGHDTTTPNGIGHVAADGAALVPELLTTAETARLCRLGERSVWRLSRSGAMPSPVRIGGAVRYRRDEILDWIRGGCKPVDGRASRSNG